MSVIYREGQVLRVVDVPGVPLRNCTVIVKKIYTQAHYIKYFCVAYNGKDGWVLQEHLTRTDAPTQRALYPLTQIAEELGLKKDSLRHAINRKGLKAEKVDGTYHSTFDDVRDYKKRMEFERKQRSERLMED